MYFFVCRAGIQGRGCVAERRQWTQSSRPRCASELGTWVAPMPYGRRAGTRPKVSRTSPSAQSSTLLQFTSHRCTVAVSLSLSLVSRARLSAATSSSSNPRPQLSLPGQPCSRGNSLSCDLLLHQVALTRRRTLRVTFARHHTCLPRNPVYCF